MAALYAINLTNPTLKSNFFVNFVFSKNGEYEDIDFKRSQS